MIVYSPLGRTWYLSFDNEEDTKACEEYLTGKKLKEKDIRMRIKAEPIVKPPVYIAPAPEEMSYEFKVQAFAPPFFVRVCMCP